jgi:hypothetical protein
VNTDPAKIVCQDSCAEYGDAPCYEVHEDLRRAGKAVGPWEPCEDCRKAVGVEVIEPVDPSAVLRPLL